MDKAIPKLPSYITKLIDKEFEQMCIRIMGSAKDESGMYVSVGLEDIFEYIQDSMKSQAKFWMGQTKRNANLGIK